MKKLNLLIVVLTGTLLLYATGDFPYWADPNSPANSYISPYYLEHSLEDTSVPNVVSSVLADYRGFDTMLETSVVFTAMMAIILLLRRTTKFFGEQAVRVEVEIPPNLIIRTSTRILVPIMQLFALYVLCHGHHSPGGGFQGGVILGAALILFAMAFSLRETLERFSEKKNIFSANLGVFIYAGIGAACLLLGSNFLDYGALHSVLGVDRIEARSLGILGIELGVGLAVMAAMISIYADLATKGDLGEGL